MFGAPCMGHQLCHCATCYLCANTISAACQDHGNSCAKNHTCAVCVCEKGQLLSEDVAGFEVRCQKDVWIARNCRLYSFCFCRLFADGIIEGQWSIKDPAVDLSTFRHLAKGGRVDSRGHL